jgi:hypothetical protein
MLVGSCFSDEIAERFRYAGFTVHANPLGTIFHPISIARFLSFVLAQHEYSSDHIFHSDCYTGSWESSTRVRTASKDEMVEFFSEVKNNWINQLEKASHLFITLGTAWGYERHGYGIVANCHKFPQSDFSKVMTSAEEIQYAFQPVLEELSNRFPQLNVVFTISPVRHVRDGLVENNRSKAELIAAVHRLTAKSEKWTYFPSYELVIDVLRDYRFYKKDRVHPSDEAIDCVWDELLNAYGSETLRNQLSSVERFRKLEHHKLVHATETERQLWVKRIDEERHKLEQSLPGILL